MNIVLLIYILYTLPLFSKWTSVAKVWTMNIRYFSNETSNGTNYCHGSPHFYVELHSQWKPNCVQALYLFPFRFCFLSQFAVIDKRSESKVLPTMAFILSWKY